MTDEPPWPLGVGVPAGVPVVASPDTGVLAAARIKVAHEAPLNVEWPEYGADPSASGATNAAAVNAAIAALPANGGEILLPRRYPTTATVVLDGRENVKLRGLGGKWNGRSGIDYTGVGTAVSIKGTGGSTDGTELENLTIADAANTAAILVDLGTSSGVPTNAGSSNCGLEGCYLAGNNGTATLLNLAQAISGSFRDTAFVGGNIGVQGVGILNGFSNSHTFDGDCYFTGQKVAPIKNPYQNWAFRGATVEPMSGGGAGFVIVDPAVLPNGVDGFDFIGSSVQDSNGTGIWFQIFGHAINLIGSFLEASCVSHVKLLGATDGFVVIGCRLSGASASRAIDLNGQAPTGTVILGDSWNNGGNDINGNPGAGSIVQVPNFVGVKTFGWAIVTNGPLDVQTAGQGLRVIEGANCKQGVSAAMVGGTVTVPNASVTANSRIILTRQAGGANPGAVYESARVAGTSFTITSTNAADTGTVAYQIFEPG